LNLGASLVSTLGTFSPQSHLHQERNSPWPNTALNRLLLPLRTTDLVDCFRDSPQLRQEFLDLTA